MSNFVVYDIPTASKIANPSAKLRPIGVRLNLSCWMIPNTGMNKAREVFEKIIAEGASVEFVYDAVRDPDQIKRLAANALRTETARIRASLAKAIGRTEKALSDRTGDLDADKVSVLFRRAKRHLEHAQQCAMLFDVTLELGDLIGAGQAEIKAREQAFEAFVAGLSARPAGNTTARRQALQCAAAPLALAQ